MPRQRIHHSRVTYQVPHDFPERLERFKEESGAVVGGDCTASRRPPRDAAALEEGTGSPQHAEHDGAGGPGETPGASPTCSPTRESALLRAPAAAGAGNARRAAHIAGPLPIRTRHVGVALRQRLHHHRGIGWRQSRRGPRQTPRRREEAARGRPDADFRRWRPIRGPAAGRSLRHRGRPPSAQRGTRPVARTPGHAGGTS